MPWANMTLNPTLPQIGFQSKFPRTLLYGPSSAQGGELISIRITQLIAHLDMLMRHDNSHSLTGRLLGNCIEGLQLESGA